MSSKKFPTNVKGEFVRVASSFRHRVTADGSSGFKAEAGRYHLYVSLACPWASRTLMLRAFKGLDDVISVTVVDWLMGPGGWKFTDQKPRCTLDTVNGKSKLSEIYFSAEPEYSGRYTVPVLWDKQKQTIVNNESSEIIRMLNTEFNAFCKTDEQRALDLYPESLRKQIDEFNEWIYPTINNGVYRCGFAQSQEAYDAAVEELFISLEKVEGMLSASRYLCGDAFTEADVRLFVTLIRFDPVYVQHFKCSKKRIMDYPHLWAYTREIYQMPGVRDTVDFEHIRKHYMQSHLSINPSGIIHILPEVNPALTAPHNRDKMVAK